MSRVYYIKRAGQKESLLLALLYALRCRASLSQLCTESKIDREREREKEREREAGVYFYPRRARASLGERAARSTMIIIAPAKCAFAAAAACCMRHATSSRCLRAVAHFRFPKARVYNVHVRAAALVWGKF